MGEKNYKYFIAVKDGKVAHTTREMNWEGFEHYKFETLKKLNAFLKKLK